LLEASLHDSQVAIPMARRTAQRLTSLYDLMDSAYEAKEIKQSSRELGHVPIVDRNRRPANSVPLEPASIVRFRERSTAERGNSRLKDEFGCRHLRVRGHKKAHLHVMFAILAVFADQLLKPFTT
jgi:Transposase DDE domain